MRDERGFERQAGGMEWQFRREHRVLTGGC